MSLTERGDVNSKFINVWDSRYAPPPKVFSIYRETICKVFMPWSPELSADTDFSARIASANFNNGLMALLNLSPLVVHRSKQDIARSAFDCFFVNYVVSGKLSIEWGRDSNILNPGDLVVHDGSVPGKLVSSGHRYEVLTLMIPKDKLSHHSNMEDRLAYKFIPHAAMIRPLSSSISFLRHNLIDSRADEISAVFDAILSLLPVGTCDNLDAQDLKSDHITNQLLRRIIEFMHDNIADHDLSPVMVAESLGISARYVHKLFATINTTFMMYLNGKRLEVVCRELLLPEYRRQPIYAISYRWGFRDTTTFFRAFKARFGCSPSQFRSQGLRAGRELDVN